jgi:hypothetical protein
MEKETKPEAEPANGKPGSKDINWSLFSDSTSINQIQIIVSEDKGKQLGSPALQQETLQLNQDVYPKDAQTDAQKLDVFKSVVIRYYKQLNLAENAMGATFVDYAITLGTALKKTKKLAKKCKEKWEDWIEKNLPAMKQRTIEKYMRLATRKDAHKYKFLGMERLLDLISATEEEVRDNEDDPIGEFLRQFGIDYNPEAESSLQDFKDSLQAGSWVRKLGKDDISVDFELMRSFVQGGGTIAKWMVDELKRIKDDSAAITKYFEEMIDNESTPRKPTNETKAGAVTIMIQRTARKIETIIKDEADVARNIDLAEIAKLEIQIASLRRLVSSR